MEEGKDEMMSLLDFGGMLSFDHCLKQPKLITLSTSLSVVMVSLVSTYRSSEHLSTWAITFFCNNSLLRKENAWRFVRHSPFPNSDPWPVFVQSGGGEGEGEGAGEEAGRGEGEEPHRRWAPPDLQVGWCFISSPGYNFWFISSQLDLQVAGLYILHSTSRLLVFIF